MQTTTKPTGQVTLTTKGGKRGRGRGGARWEPMQRHGLLAQVSNHQGGVQEGMSFRRPPLFHDI